MKAARFSRDRSRGQRAWTDRRLAFTLVELLVVIAIIGTLVGLLLPAVQTARESARLSQCGNNLKQWSLAMQTYHDVYGVLPLGGSGWTWVSTCWMPTLWPYLEQTDLANKYDYSNSWTKWGNVNNHLDRSNASPLSRRLPIYYCPSDRPGAHFAMDAGVGTFYSPRMNYAINATSVTVSSKTYRGPFALSRTNAAGTPQSWQTFESRGYKGPETARFRNITDGLSKTLVMAEVNMWTSDTGSPVDPRGQPVSNKFDTSVTPNAMFDRVPNWYTAPSYTCTDVPPYLPCQSNTGGGNIWIYAARSKHFGGVQSALADGAVQFVSNTVDQSVWQALGTMSGGETVSQ
jgi:prepilin-type N-terminal cleavage/methylation domain-containing protein